MNEDDIRLKNSILLIVLVDKRFESLKLIIMLHDEDMKMNNSELSEYFIIIFSKLILYILNIRFI